MKSTIRFTCFPRTEPPPDFVAPVVEVFRDSEEMIGTLNRHKGLTGDQMLEQLRSGIVSLGFEIESGKHKKEKVERPVFYGENGVPVLR